MIDTKELASKLWDYVANDGADHRIIAKALDEAIAPLRAEQERLRADYLRVAEALEYVNHAEGQGGYEIAPNETLVEVARRGVRAYRNADEQEAELERLREKLKKTLASQQSLRPWTTATVGAPSERGRAMGEAKPCVVCLKPRKPTTRTGLRYVPELCLACRRSLKKVSVFSALDLVIWAVERARAADAERKAGG